MGKDIYKNSLHLIGIGKEGRLRYSFKLGLKILINFSLIGPEQICHNIYV